MPPSHQIRLCQDKGNKAAYPQLSELANLPSPSYPHGCKDDGKIVVVIIQHSLGLLHQPSLAADLGGNLEWRGLGGRTSKPSPLSAVEEDGRGNCLYILLPGPAIGGIHKGERAASGPTAFLRGGAALFWHY